MIPDHISFKTHLIIFLMNSHFKYRMARNKMAAIKSNLQKTVPGFGGGVETGSMYVQYI